MIMLVYWESMVWSIIANGIVYVKYKTVYIVGHFWQAHVYEVSDGGIMLSATVLVLQHDTDHPY